MNMFRCFISHSTTTLRFCDVKGNCQSMISFLPTYIHRTYLLIFVLSFFLLDLCFAQNRIPSPPKAEKAFNELEPEAEKDKSDEEKEKTAAAIKPPLQPAIIFIDLEDQTGSKKNGELISQTATLLLESQLASIPGLRVIPQMTWKVALSELNENGPLAELKPDNPDIKNYLNENAIRFIASGSVSAYNETCLSGGYYLLGVRKIEYSLTITLTITAILKNTVILTESASSTIIDKSVGWKRRNVRLSLPGIKKLVQPAIDEIVLAIKNNVPARLRESGKIDTPLMQLNVGPREKKEK